MNKFALETMNHIDPALVEEIDLAGTKKRRLSPRLRAALIAACVCLALAGTAFAAGLIAGNFRAIDYYRHQWVAPPPGREDIIGQSLSGYILRGGAIHFLPVSSFSEEAQALALKNGENTVSKSFASLDEAAEYFQVELPENAVLGELPPVRCHVQMDSSDVGLTRLIFDETFRTVNGLEGLDLNINITALSELMYSPDREMWFDCGYPISYTFTTEEFEQDSVSAIVSHAIYARRAPSPYCYGEECYRAHLIVDGLVYEIVVSCSDCPEEGRTLLEEALTGF